MIKQYTKKTDGKKYYMFQLYLGKDEITKKIDTLLDAVSKQKKKRKLLKQG